MKEAPKLHYSEIHSDSYKPGLIFLHPLFSSSSESHYDCPHLADYHIIMIDHPAHNGSSNTVFSLDVAARGVHA
jgi:pimeloyl-ACP methyl ester carboxylesterase